MHGYIQRLAGVKPKEKQHFSASYYITKAAGMQAKGEFFMQNEITKTLPKMRTISEASRETGISQHALRAWVKSGQVPAVYRGP